MVMKWTNNAASTLAVGISDVATSLTVITGHGDRFPEIVSPDYAMVSLADIAGNREIVKLTARAAGSNTFTIVRAQEGTTQRLFAAGSLVENRVTAATLSYLNGAVLYSATLTGDITLPYSSTFMVCFPDPNGAERNITPHADFPVGSIIFLHNPGPYAEVFDPAGLNQAIGGGDTKFFMLGPLGWKVGG